MFFAIPHFTEAAKAPIKIETIVAGGKYWTPSEEAVQALLSDAKESKTLSICDGKIDALPNPIYSAGAVRIERVIRIAKVETR